MQERGIPRSRIVFSENYVQPFGWTPDGQSIAVVVVKKGDPGAEFGLVSVANGSYRRVRSFQGGFNSTFVSPDGKYTTADLEESRNAPRDIYVIRLEDARETRIEHPADDRVMGWSPDSRHVLFSSDRNTGSPALYGLTLVDGRPQSVPQLIEKEWGRCVSARRLKCD